MSVQKTEAAGCEAGQAALGKAGSRADVRIRQLFAEDLDELLDWRMEVLGVVFADDQAWDAAALREANRAFFRGALASRAASCVSSSAADGAADDAAAGTADDAASLAADGATCVACVASVDGYDLGCGAFCLQRELPSPDNPTGVCAYLMNIYTRAEARHKGVGRGVVDWLVGQARQRGAGKIYLESTRMGAPLYAQAGFVPMEGMMKLAPGSIDGQGRVIRHEG